MDELIIDLDVMRWKLAERIAFERVAHVTVERAATVLVAAADDEEKAIDIPPLIPAAFMWIAARRKNPGLSFEDAAEMFNAEDFFAAIGDAAETEAEPPLANRAQRRTSAKSAARSATTSTTRRTR